MRKLGYGCFLFLLLAVFTSCQAAKGSSGNSGGNPPPSSQMATLTVAVSGAGSGSVASQPKGINCPTNCKATFNQGTQVTLTSTAGGGSSLDSWSGACSGSAPTCAVTLNSNQSVTASFRKGDLSVINHIVIFLQENRSFDHYFGHLADYWSANGYSSEPFDEEPADASNPGTTPGTSVSAYHLTTTCVENPSPSWNESHADWNHEDPTSSTPLLDGFVRTAASEKSPTTGLPYIDSKGIRVMGYYTDRELPYYYFMASNFGTSDRWFSPVMSRTQPNRMYLYAATSHGHVYPLTPTTPVLSDPTIFQLLQNHGISWKIYVHPNSTGCSTPTCLLSQSYMNQFAFGSTIVHQYPQNLVPISQYFTDVQNGTLPQVAFIEPASQELLDEHPADDDLPANAIPNVQTGSHYAASLINALMTSSSWKDSVFFLSFDEGGGFYDHVPPQPAVSPDGIPPSDLVTTPTPDICSASNNPGGYTCNFTLTGYRVPMIVISPYAKKHYVSHTVADYTALLKFIETRFNLPSLTARDAAQMDMSEFFDFAGEPWAKPPTPPDQPTNGPCYLDHLP